MGKAIRFILVVLAIFIAVIIGSSGGSGGIATSGLIGAFIFIYIFPSLFRFARRLWPQSSTKVSTSLSHDGQPETPSYKHPRLTCPGCGQGNIEMIYGGAGKYPRYQWTAGRYSHSL